jgi:hypothetical protein
MPWQGFKYLSDDEIKAIFAYLKTAKPIENVVPSAQSPVLAPRNNIFIFYRPLRFLIIFKAFNST